MSSDKRKKNTFPLPFTARILALIFYLVILTYFLFFAEGLGRTGGGFANNFIPFKEIIREFVRFKKLGCKYFLLNFVGNIVCFIPFGFLFASLFRYPRTHAGTMVTGVSCALSVLVEVIQLVSATGSCDVDDVILNTVGGMVGYLIFRGLFVRVLADGREEEQTAGQQNNVERK